MKSYIASLINIWDGCSLKSIGMWWKKIWEVIPPMIRSPGSWNLCGIGMGSFFLHWIEWVLKLGEMECVLHITINSMNNNTIVFSLNRKDRWKMKLINKYIVAKSGGQNTFLGFFNHHYNHLWTVLDAVNFLLWNMFLNHWYHFPHRFMHHSIPLKLSKMFQNLCSKAGHILKLRSRRRSH